MSATASVLRTVYAVRARLGGRGRGRGVPAAVSFTSTARFPLLLHRRRSPYFSRPLSSAPADEAVALERDVADAGMDAVQRRLMFEDECILVDEHDNVVGHDSKYNWEA